MIILWSSYDHIMIMLWSSYNHFMIIFQSYNHFRIILWLSYDHHNIILRSHLKIILQLSYDHSYVRCTQKHFSPNNSPDSVLLNFSLQKLIPCHNKLRVIDTVSHFCPSLIFVGQPGCIFPQLLKLIFLNFF